MKNSEYWRKRFEAIEKEKFLLTDKYYKNVVEAFEEANKELTIKLLEWYARFADNNDVTLAQARKLLSSKKLEEFKWTVEEYIKYGKENAINQEWMQQLENVSARVHISHFETAKIELQQIVTKFYGLQEKQITQAVIEVYNATSLRTTYEIQKGMKQYFDFRKINQRQLEKVINAPWVSDAKNFSERIWGDCNKMVLDLQNQLQQNIILGRAPDESIKIMANKFQVSKSKAANLIQTESSYFYSRAQKDTFSELSVEQFQFIATLDSKTSAICRSMDEKVFAMNEYKIGVNAPPLHCRCRSCTVPYFETDFNIEDSRAYRKSDGKTDWCEDLPYEKWKEKYVKENKDETN